MMESMECSIKHICFHLILMMASKSAINFCLFLNYIYWLCYYSCPNFPPFSPLHSAAPNSLRQSLHHCSCPWVMCISPLATPFPILNLTCPWLFCNYLFVLLNPLTSLPMPPHPPSNRQPSKQSPYPWSVSVLLVGLVWCFRFNCC